MILEKAPENIKKIIKAYCALSKREKIILEARYCERMKQEEVAKILKVSPERIRQLEERAIDVIIEELK
jgi:RNA polymerase sigma factor (sigma-70 family)